ncbi:transposase [Cupriavidus sp. WGtm5]|uniref:transposase n=1 Tax=unclassified Cupriavidus TaxID=2640874 RepID=UPI002090A247|nr:MULTISPECIES: transposase [unclassified Cupriavidus]MCO4865984.1 transposase [Cupriavidus sp. WGlv3]MCO4893638.1 transposase [Cupriavidus sp. WGtm5]
MIESPELKVVSSNSRGRKRYDKASKRALVEACLIPGVSIARRAQDSGVHVSLLRKWIAQYLLERERSAGELAMAVGQDADLPERLEDSVAQAGMMAQERPSAFAAVHAVSAPAGSLAVADRACSALALHVRLPNGVELDLSPADLEGLTTIVQMLGRMPCSGSTMA